MKKQTRTLVVLAAALAVVIIAYFGISAWTKSRDEAAAKAAEDEVITLSKLTDITGIRYKYQGEVLDFAKNTEGTWEFPQDARFPLDTGMITGIEETLSELIALRSFENKDGAAAYGLEEPSMWLEATTSGGESFTLNIGNTAGSGAGRYASVSGSEMIYTVEDEVVSAFSYTLTELAVVVNFPALSESNITSVNLYLDGRTLDMRKDTATDDSGDTVYTWYLQVDSEAAEIPAAGTTLLSMLSELGSLSFAGLHAFRIDSAVLQSCGLDSPQYTVYVDYEDGSLALQLGSTDENGYFYAMLNDSPYIYLLNPTLVATLITIDDSNIFLQE